MKVEKSEARSRERFQKRKLSRGASSSTGKRVRESQTESVHSYATRGRRQGNTVVPSTGRGALARPGETPECPHCHRWHLRVCKLLTGGCFRCGSTEHFMENCPKESGDNRNPQSNSKERSATPPSTRDRGRIEGAKASIKDEEGTVSETVDRPMASAPARAYDMKARGGQDAPEVIAGIISLYGIEMHALIDHGSTHSYVCIEYVFDKMTVVEQLSYDMHVTSPLGHSVNVNKVYKNCPIIIHEREFFADLIALPFREFDLILGMDWLSKHWAIIDYDKKAVVLRCFDQSKVIVHGVRSDPMSNVISAM